MEKTTSRGTFGRFRRYETTADLSRWHAMALASIVPPSEEFVFGIDCADRWLLTHKGTKLVLTDDRVVAFRPDPADPLKRTYPLRDLVEITYQTNILSGEIRLLSSGFDENYTVPRRLGREFVDAVRRRLG